jgi:Fe2+ transport system protein B
MLKGVTMNDEILNNNEEQPDEKELLRQRREEQIERVKAQYETDVKEKAEAKVRMEKEQELEKELAPFITVRKGLIALCGLMWVFAAFCLLTGTLEMKIFLPMCMFALAALAGVNVPIFVKKKKIFDGIIAGICTVICFVTGVIILMFG